MSGAPDQSGDSRTQAAPAPADPAPQPIGAAAADGADGGGLADEHPEVLVGGAFLGGLVIAQLLKRFGS